MENHRISKIKRIRKSGFRARMRTRKGRDIINRQRRRRKGLG
ncbi:MAG: 50S ribosomal protein L34 [Sedimentisphaerales bacterium]|nr:50S ribosomal protein L34 [Sedimentisphaerales bacterium]